MIIRHIAAFLLLSLTFLLSISFTEPHPIQQPKQPLKRIIIDAGHGGTDVGAKGRYSTEKDLCLTNSLK